MDIELAYVPRPRERWRQRIDLGLKRPGRREAAQATRSPCRGSNHRQIQRGLSGDGSGGVIARAVADALEDVALDPESVEVFARLLHALDAAGSAVVRNYDTVRTVALIAEVQDVWCTTRCHGPLRLTDDSAIGQAVALVPAIVARYPAPQCLIDAFTCNLPPMAPLRRAYALIGAGRNPRREGVELPMPLTNAMIGRLNHLPREMGIGRALRAAQAIELGIEEPWLGFVLDTRLVWFQQDEAFWSRFMEWLAANQAACEPEWIPDIVNYVAEVRFGEPDGADGDVDVGWPVVERRAGYEMAGRSVRAVWGAARRLALARQHAASRDPNVPTHWDACGVPAWAAYCGRWRVTELTTARELAAEGEVMRNCVGDYVEKAARRSCAIFSLQHHRGGTWRPAVTIEVNPSTMEIVQAAAACNSMPTGVDRVRMRTWARVAGLSLHADLFDL